MSRGHQRKEKNCLNCGTIIVGKYCHECGQENVEPKETVWQLVSHFFTDITHFDGKIFTSIKDLVLKPGFLSKEYTCGKRAGHLNPIQMYFFTSFIFFLVFFSLYRIDERNLNELFIPTNSDKIDSGTLRQLSETIKNGKIKTKEDFRKLLDPAGGTGNNTMNFESRAQFDSFVKSRKAPPGWLEKKVAYKVFEIKEKYRSDPQMFFNNFANIFLHSIPQMLFILLPLFALYLKLLYVRNKKYYYADHAIFIIHSYIFVFLDMLVIFGIIKLSTVSRLNWLGYFNIVLTLGIFSYMYKAMRNFYEQKRGRTILKFLLLNLSFLITGIFLLVVFVFLSLYQV